MTSVIFDPGAGRLRLEQRAFDCLVNWQHGGAEPSPELEALREAGVIVDAAEGDDSAHPVLAAGLQAVVEQLCQLRLELHDDAGDHKAGDGWIGYKTATLLLDLPEEQRELVTMHPLLLPAAVARLVRLGPRATPASEPLHMPGGVFDMLLSDDEQTRRAAVGDLAAPGPDSPIPAALDCAEKGPWRCWTATMCWHTPEGKPAGQVLQVLDLEDGLYLCQGDEQTVTLQPASASNVWRRLTTLVPRAVEMT